MRQACAALVWLRLARIFFLDPRTALGRPWIPPFLARSVPMWPAAAPGRRARAGCQGGRTVPDSLPAQSSGPTLAGHAVSSADEETLHKQQCHTCALPNVSARVQTSVVFFSAGPASPSPSWAMIYDIALTGQAAGPATLMHLSGQRPAQRVAKSPPRSV